MESVPAGDNTVPTIRNGIFGWIWHPRPFALAGLGILLMLGVGCRLVTTPVRTVMTPGAKKKAALPTEMQAEVMRMADQYSVVMAQSCDAFAAKVDTPPARMQALSHKINQASAAISIATGPSPMVNVLDLVVLATLTRISVEKYWVGKDYGESAKPLLETHRRLEAEVWRLAGRRLSQEQLQQLRELLEAWHKKYPEQRYSAFLPLTELVALLGKEQAAAKTQGGSLLSLFNLDPLAGLDPAIRQLEQTRFLAERAMYYGQRLPILLQWRAELLLLTSLKTPEVRQTLDIADRFTRTTEQLPALVEQQREAAIRQLFEGVAQERTNILASLLVQEEQARGLLMQIRATLETGTQTATAVQGAVGSGDTFLRGLKEKSDSKPSRPFDIREYNQALSNATATATQLELLLRGMDQNLPKVVAGSKDLVHHTLVLGFVLGALLIVLTFLLLVLYRWVQTRWR